MASIVLDDLSDRLKYGGGGGPWSTVSGARYFGGSSTWPGFAADDKGDTGDYGTIDLAFQGTSIAFFGNTPPAINSQSILVSIDGAEPYNSSYEDPAPQSTRQWYQSPTLSDTNHSISISHLSTTSVDFVVINVGNSTPLSGETLIVDDNDPSIVYNGNWTIDKDRFHASDYPLTGYPLGNSTHQTSTPGASVTFRFAGTSISMYGIGIWNIVGEFALKYTLDGTSLTKTYTMSSSVPQSINGAQQPNFLFYSNDTLSLDSHSLDVELVVCSGQRFILDYFLYQPSFDTLASKPNLTTIPGSVSGADANKSPPVGPIVGGVLGGIVFLTSIVLLLFLCRKRLYKSNIKGRSKIRNTSEFEPFMIPLVSPNTSRSRPSSSANSDAGAAPYDSPSFAGAMTPPANHPPMSQHKPTPPSSSTGILGPVISAPSLAQHKPTLSSSVGVVAPSPSPGLTQHKPMLSSSSDGTLASITSPPGLARHKPAIPSSSTGIPVPTTSSPGLARHKPTLPPSSAGIQPPETPPPSSAQHNLTLSSSSTGTFSQTVSSPSPEMAYYEDEVDRRGGADTSGGDAFRNRMQRLQDLVQELNREIESGVNTEGIDSLRVSELRGRIAELTRQGIGGTISGGSVSRGRRTRVTVSQSGTLPPAYDYEPMAG